MDSEHGELSCDAFNMQFLCFTADNKQTSLISELQE